MPWWSWIVIWVALLALSLLYVVLLGIKLWRHVVGLGREFSAASARMGSPLAQPSAELATSPSENPSESPGEDVPAEREPGWALYSDPGQLVQEYGSGKRSRQAERARRRVHRRGVRGQAQSLRDLEHMDKE